MMNGNKLAVVFPGIGYHCDKPLLYYTKKLAKEYGYEILEINYKFPHKAKDIKGDKDKMRNAFAIAIEQVEDQLSSVEFDKYEDILFIGKSIGTTVAACYAKEHDIDAGQIVLTPVPETFNYLKPGSGIVFHGTADPWCDTDYAKKRCTELNLEMYLTENANHSLECGEVKTDVRNIEFVLECVEKYFMARR